MDDNWNNLLDELFEQLESLREPVWGVGHSFGGMLHYRAALLRPTLERAAREARELELDPATVLALFTLILKESP